MVFFINSKNRVYFLWEENISSYYLDMIVWQSNVCMFIINKILYFSNIVSIISVWPKLLAISLIALVASGTWRTGFGTRRGSGIFLSFTTSPSCAISLVIHQERYAQNKIKNKKKISIIMLNSGSCLQKVRKNWKTFKFRV